MELSDISLRKVALIIKSHGEHYGDSSWYSNAPIETQSRLMFIQDGRMYYKIDDKKYSVERNQLILIPENHQVEFGVPKTELVHIRYCNFNAAFGDKSIFDYLDGDWIIDVDNPKKIIDLFKRFDYVDKSNIIKDFISKKLSLLSILDEFFEKSNMSVIEQKEYEKLDLDGMVDFIKRNVNSTDTVNLEYLAKMAHVHPSYLSREFKKKYGKSPMQFVLDERIEEAKRLLTNTTLSVGAVAENMKFENVKYFSKFFKRRTGMTPSEYRKNK